MWKKGDWPFYYLIIYLNMVESIIGMLQMHTYTDFTLQY